MVTETITAEHEPHFGGLLSHSGRFLDQSGLDAGGATLYFQSNNPGVKYHRVQWIRAWYTVWQLQPSTANTTLCLHKRPTTDLLSERRAERTPGSE